MMPINTSDTKEGRLWVPNMGGPGVRWEVSTRLLWEKSTVLPPPSCLLRSGPHRGTEEWDAHGSLGWEDPRSLGLRCPYLRVFSSSAQSRALLPG